MAGENERRDPFDRPPSPEPIDDAAAIQAAIRGRVGKVRKKIHPSEKRRRQRRVGLTFSDPGIPERLRALAQRWGMFAPDGQSPHVSAVVEYLLLPRLEAAERGELDPPGE